VVHKFGHNISLTENLQTTFCKHAKLSTLVVQAFCIFAIARLPGFVADWLSAGSLPLPFYPVEGRVENGFIVPTDIKARAQYSGARHPVSGSFRGIGTV
jgi:hypothetical protein